MTKSVRTSPMLALGLAAVGLLSFGAAGCHLEGEAQYGSNDWDQVAPAPAAPPVAETVASEVVVDAEDEDATALATFRPALDPYGQWVDDGTYGTVWVPNSAQVGADFSPYLTGGHWTYTDEGYYWASDYEWGWATFHYGRWVWSDGYGWVWIPGARYAPAWVDWRYGSGYLGWGPAYPHYCWRNGAVVYIGPGVTPYVFVQNQHFFHPHPHTVVAGPAYHPGLVAGTTPYTPPPRPLTGAKPFVGPDWKAAGIPTDHVAKATVTPPVKGRPEHMAWTPVAGSKVAPPGKPYIPPASKPAIAATPGYAGPKPGVVGPPTYGPKPGPTYAPAPKPYTPPTYGPQPPTYAPAPKPYTPPPVYSPAPKPYSPPPVYSPAPKPYSPPPVYSPAPKPYSPPVFSPAPKPYSPPPVYSPGPKPSFKKK